MVNPQTQHSERRYRVGFGLPQQLGTPLEAQELVEAGQ